MKKMNLQLFAEPSPEAGVVGRYLHPGYIDVTGGSEEPQYELLGTGVTQLDDSPSAQTTSKRYVNNKSATQRISSYEWTAPDAVLADVTIVGIDDVTINIRVPLPGGDY